MTPEPKTASDDRAFDADLARLCDGAAHLIDVVRVLVRSRLDVGDHPVDAVGGGLGRNGCAPSFNAAPSSSRETSGKPREARERLSVAPAVYDGEIETRVVCRGVVLTGLPGRLDVTDWLCEVLGLDGYLGDHAVTRLTVELLDDEPVDREPVPHAEPDS